MAQTNVKSLHVDDLLTPDRMGQHIANKWLEWNMLRQNKVRDWEELRRYIFATDTTTTTNSQLPWKNKTTIPKITQIRDNLHANYMAALFPKRKWLFWFAEDKDSAEKAENVLNYMKWVTDRPEFKSELSRIVLDYIDYGNCFWTVEWVNENDVYSNPTSPKYGLVGPRPVRISPLDIVFNPVAATFHDTPKIIRSIVQRGDLKTWIGKDTDMEDAAKEQLLDYFNGIRLQASSLASDLHEKDNYLRVDGYTDFRQYLQSDYVELLTFYGDIYDEESQEIKRNRKIIVADRHKIIYDEENASIFAAPQIFHAGWRIRQDNLWAMGPLDNLVGMQYRIDHIENLKADAFDLLVFPLLKIKGYVEDFEWRPMERINIGDDGEVEVIAPDVSVLQANLEIQALQAQMEEMAGAPKEAAGFRTPGEKTAYEVQRIENAYNRIFGAKIRQFEQHLEEGLNAMLEIARRRMTSQSISIWDDEFKIQLFQELTPEDISGLGRLRPLAAQHFAEKSEKIQNLTNFFSSPIGQDQMVRQHFSSIRLAKMAETLLDLSEDEVVQPYINVTEQQELARQTNVAEEQVMMETTTPAGISEDDIDEEPPIG